MKFGTAATMMVACAWLGTSEGKLLKDSTSPLRGARRRTQTDGATVTGTAPTNTATTSGTGTTSFTVKTGGNNGRPPVKQIKGHIGGGTYDGIKVLNNIGYALLGYDVVKGNPLDTSGLVKVDLGFRQPIFAPDQYDLMIDREYYAPSSVSVVECEGCNMHATTKVLDTMSDYVSSLKTKVSAGVSRTNPIGVSGEFSASFDYNQAKENMVRHHRTSTESEISCCVYQAELNGYQLPPFSGNFLQAVARLQRAASMNDESSQRKLQEAATEAETAESAATETAEEAANEEAVTVTETAEEAANEEAVTVTETAEEAANEQPTQEEMNVGSLEVEVARFIQEFGTHYVKKVTMGSLFGEQTFLSQEDTRDMMDRGIDIGTAASTSVGTISGKADFGLDSSVKDTQEFLSKTTHKSVYSRGAKPVGDGDTDTWLLYSSENPVPTYVEIEAIQDLDVYNDPSVVQAIVAYVQNYCNVVEGAECELPEGVGSDEEESETRTSQSDFAGSHQPSFQRKEHNAFENNENYETRAEWLITGLEGTIEDATTQLSAIVSTLGPNHVHSTGDVGWTGWTRYDQSDLACEQNEAVVRIRSNIGFSGDRQFGLNCASVSGMQILNDRQAPDGLSMISTREDIAQIDWFPATFGESFEKECPFNHVLVGIKTIRDPNNNRNLQWKLKCALMKPADSTRTVGETTVTPTWNRFEDNFIYVSPPRVALDGLLADYNPELDDSRFRFAEVWLGYPTVGSVWSTDWEFDPSDIEEQEFSCGGLALTGFKSQYNADAEGPARNFKFECRTLENHRLIHADERTANEGSAYNEADWTESWAGNGSSFGLDCAHGKVLSGVKVKYDPETRDIAWKALCLFARHN